MKILFLTPWYPDERSPNHGIFVRDQAVALRRSHDVWLISSKIDYSHFAVSSFERRDSEFLGVKEIRLRVKRSLPVFNQLNYFFLTIRETLKIAKAFKPDIIHGNIGYPGAFWAWWVSRALKIPYVVTEHTRVINNFRSFFHKQLALFGLKRSAAIITVSRMYGEEIARLSGKQPEVIPNIVDVNRFPGIMPKPDAEVFQIGFLGGFETPVKGLDILLEALAGVKKDFVLHVGGKGRLKEQYEALSTSLGIRDKCIFCGFVPHQEVPAFMKKIHFLVSASRFETFGLVLVEAMACGIPVVATATSGPKDFVTKDNGILVEPENVEQLKKGIEEMMENYEKFDPETVRHSVITRFSEEQFRINIERLYDKVLSSAK